MNMMRLVATGTMLISIVWTAGCATTTFRVAKDANVNGIRYYRPATYILVKPDYVNLKASVTFWSGPDTSVPYAADPSAFCSTNTSELQFNRGMLTTVTIATDSTKIATDIISALGEVGKAMLANAAKAASLAAAAGESTERTAKEAPIYLFVVTADGQFKQIFGRGCSHDPPGSQAGNSHDLSPAVKGNSS